MAQASAIPGPSQTCNSNDEEYSDEQFVKIVEDIWDLKINVQDLHQLKPELVQQIYFSFLKDIGVNLEKYNQIPPQLLDCVQFHEEYMGALRLIMLATDVRKCFKLIFNDDTFRPVDLFSPKPKRSKKYFAMIYDFLMFTDNIFPEVKEKEDEVSALVEHRDKMRAKILKLKQLIHERRTENEKNQLAKEEEKRRVQAKTEELQKCQEEKLALKAQFDALGLSLKELDLDIKNTELRIMEANSEKQRLECLVIQPNEEQEIRERDEKLALLKEEHLKKKDHLAQLRQRISFMNATKEKLDKFVSLLQEIQQEKSRGKDIQTTIQQMVSQVTELQEEIKDQAQQNLQLMEKLAASETKLQHVHQAWDLKQESINKEIKEQKQVLKDLQRNQTEQDIVCQATSDEVAHLDKQITQSKEEIRNINTMIRNNYKIILDALEEGNVELMTALTETTNCVEEFKLEN